MKYYYPKHFEVREFVPEAVYTKLGETAILVMDKRMLVTADTVRDFFGSPVTINNWFKRCGKFQNSGFRLQTEITGAVYSQHKFGRALDMRIRGVSAEKAREAILNNRNCFPYITVMERDVSWLHVDCRCTDSSEIIMFKP